MGGVRAKPPQSYIFRIFLFKIRIYLTFFSKFGTLTGFYLEGMYNKYSNKAGLSNLLGVGFFYNTANFKTPIPVHVLWKMNSKYKILIQKRF
jgi:hypothetical protein